MFYASLMPRKPESSELLYLEVYFHSQIILQYFPFKTSKIFTFPRILSSTHKLISKGQHININYRLKLKASDNMCLSRIISSQTRWVSKRKQKTKSRWFFSIDVATRAVSRPTLISLCQLAYHVSAGLCCFCLILWNWCRRHRPKVPSW